MIRNELNLFGREFLFFRYGKLVFLIYFYIPQANIRRVISYQLHFTEQPQNKINFKVRLNFKYQRELFQINNIAILKIQELEEFNKINKQKTQKQTINNYIALKSYTYIFHIDQSLMNLLSEPQKGVVRSPSKVQSPSKQPSNSNAQNMLLKQQWKTQEDYKRQIVNLELQNEKYRNELYELGQTVNKILDKVKVPQQKNYAYTPNLEQQLQLAKKELHNVNQFIQIYQKELNVLGNKKKKDQIQNLAATQELLKSKTEELNLLKKQVKQISHKNKGLEYKLLEYSKKNRVKSVDQQALQLKELINENKSLKTKLHDLEILQSRKQKWLQNNIQSAKQLQKKVHDQQGKLPRIQSRQQQQPVQRSSTSLPKLQSQKKIYTKWLESSAHNAKKNPAIEKQLQDLEKINKMVQDKIKNTSQQIKDIEQQIEKLKIKVQQNQQETIKQTEGSKGVISEESSIKIKKKNVGTMVTKRARKVRKDWVGKFDGMRFSDNRYIRQECRLYKVLFNSMGYCQFFYYSVKDNKKRFNSKLPFETSNLASPGKQSTFTVEFPDFIKNIRLKLNVKTHRVSQMSLISNLGIEADFQVDSNLHNIVPNAKNNQKGITDNKGEGGDVNYQMDIKPNEAITYMFGSYGTRLDEKKNVSHAWLQGVGVQIIEDFVEELI